MTRTIEIKGRAPRREYQNATRGEPDIWPEKKGDKVIWRCRNVSPFEMARFLVEFRSRRQARDGVTPEQRKQRMKAQLAKRMAALRARGYEPPRDLSRVRPREAPLCFLPPAGVRSD